VNIDKVYVPGVDLVEDCRLLRSFDIESVDIIYASHILDQFGRWEYLDALRRWHTLLKPQGLLYISVPDFDAIVTAYQFDTGLQRLQGLLHGGQDHPGWTRSVSWNFDSLCGDLWRAGFKPGSIRRYDWESIPDFASRDDYSQSYLPHLDKTGRLMSLNLQAEK
jgi:predicted SAM-dependent methyltransferase